MPPNADLLGFIIPAIFVFLVVTSLWKLLHDLQNPQRNQRPGQPRPGERPLPPAAARQPERTVDQSQLNAEIEQFLRRANQRRAEKAKRAGEKSEPVTSSQSAGSQQSAAQQSGSGKPKSKSSQRRDFDKVATLVREHLDSRPLEQHASSLGKEVAQADVQFEQRLHETFDHRLGTLGDATPTIAPQSDAQQPASERRGVTARVVAGLALTPDNIRQAVLLKEILERPENRW